MFCEVYYLKKLCTQILSCSHTKAIMKRIIGLLVLASLWLAGCKTDPPLPAEPAPLPPLDSVEVVETPDPYFLKNYKGNIDGKYDIEMVLVNWGDGFLSGRYWYTCLLYTSRCV